jgi:uncharacterized protein YndB with AHSA1/START domain
MTHTATISRSLPAPPRRVWRALTTAELGAWFWPPRFQTVAEVEPRPGGSLRLRSAPMGMGVTGDVLEAEAPHRLRVRWRWDGEDGETTVAIELVPGPGGTRVDVTHGGFATAAEAEEHATGWADCLDRLPAHLAGDADPG